MTAEVAIMNHEGIALAADSAVTATSTSVDNEQKIFLSANKLFALSDTAPVGALVYGRATFMLVPWAVLLKDYRTERRGQRFATLPEYADDLCTFLAKEAVPKYIDRGHQLHHARHVVNTIFREIYDAAFDAALAAWDGQQPGGPPIATATAEKTAEYRQRAMDITDIPPGYLSTVRNMLRPYLRTQRREIFSDEILTRELVQSLNVVAVRAAAGYFADISLGSTSFDTGIAVAGFGENEAFPSLIRVRLQGFLADTLQRQTGRHSRVAPDNSAIIVPLAQRDMIDQFMSGMASSYVGYIAGAMLSQLDTYVQLVAEELPSEYDRSEFIQKLTLEHPKIIQDVVKDIRKRRDTEFARPILDVVATLPTDQLAAMAEALVSLTSLKRRVSRQAETVGGPTDVALITKGDGLIWIKRKHYFEPELNPAYFARRFGARGT